MKFFKLLFSESNEVSCMRFLAVLSLIVGSGLAAYGIYTGKDIQALTKLVSLFIGGSFGGKFGQKFLENGSDDKTR